MRCLLYCLGKEYKLASRADRRRCEKGREVTKFRDCKKACCYLGLRLPRPKKPLSRTEVMAKPERKRICFKDHRRKCRQKRYGQRTLKRIKVRQICRGTYSMSQNTLDDEIRGDWNYSNGMAVSNGP